MTRRRPILTLSDRAFPCAALLVGVALAGLVLFASPAAGEGATEGGPETTAGGWWSGLSSANKVFFCIAFFFSALFLWQFVMTLIGLAGSGADTELDADTDAGVDMDADAHADFEADHAGDLDGDAHAEAVEVTAHDTTVSFKLLSIRSIITGGMLFGWAGALYLFNGTPLRAALLYAVAWAVAGALVIAVLMYLMRHLQETGTPRLATCVGQPATVYMDIPASGAGKVRAVVSGAVSFIPARTADGQPMKAGTPVRVTRLLDTSTVEVAPTDD
jgi:membrane protein implicated in regulation of membrane protease activity